MSDESQNAKHEENTSASAEDSAIEKISLVQAQRFFESVTRHPCPCCGNAEWTFMVGMGKEEDIRTGLPIYLELNQEGGDTVKLRKMILIECRTCGFMRMHNPTVVAKWIRKEGHE